MKSLLDRVFGGVLAKKREGLAVTSAVPSAPAHGEFIVDWKNEPTYDLWFDLPDALDHIPGIVSHWDLSEKEADLLRKWVIDGYFTLSDIYDAADIDSYAEQVDSAWYAEAPVENLAISDVVVDGVKHIHLQHADLIQLPLEQRLEAKAISNWRIGEFHLYNQAARKIFDNPKVAKLCSAIFDRPGYPHFSLTFSKGSVQLLHQDAFVFHTWPLNALIGVWAALEDIKPDSGPLVYYPGSHREKVFAEFDNYPQTQRRTSAPDQSDRYQRYVEDIGTRHERKEFLAKKGEVLFWHGMLVHGGAQYVAPGTTRKSFVIHYMPDGANVGHRVKGPFNW